MDHARMTDHNLRDLVGVLLKTRSDELTCDEWLDHVGSYAEAAAAGSPAPEGSDRVAHHLSLCPECREEFEALLAALRPSS